MPSKADTEDFTEASNPEALFNQWFDDAERTEINDANAMTLATVDKNGMPNARVVLLKGLDARGFVFYTNFESAKGQELLANPESLAVLSIGNRCAGRCACAERSEPVSTAEADAYYASRPIGSRIGAWASQQSRPLEQPPGADRCGGALREGIRGHEPGPPALLVRLPRHPARNRVLGGPAAPAARPRQLHPREPGHALDEDAALSVNICSPGAAAKVATPHPSPLPRKLALASLPLQDVRIRKRMRTGEGSPAATVATPFGVAPLDLLRTRARFEPRLRCRQVCSSRNIVNIHKYIIPPGIKAKTLCPFFVFFPFVFRVLHRSIPLLLYRSTPPFY